MSFREILCWLRPALVTDVQGNIVSVSYSERNKTRGVSQIRKIDPPDNYRIEPYDEEDLTTSNLHDNRVEQQNCSPSLKQDQEPISNRI